MLVSIANSISSISSIAMRILIHGATRRNAGKEEKWRKSDGETCMIN